MSECSICIETFNKVQRKKVICPYCVTEMCRSCVQTWVKEHPMTPRCPVPTCQAGWSEDFLSDSLTKTFLLKEFKAAKEVVLLDMERARLPESQERARRYKDAKALVDSVDALIKPIKDRMETMPERVAHMAARKAYHDADRMYWQGNYNRWTGIYAGKETEYSQRRTEANTHYTNTGSAYYSKAAQLKTQMAKLRTREYKEAQHLVVSYGIPPVVGGAGAPTTTKSEWTFVMKCPSATCEGFVGNDWACGLCAQKVCKDCREPTEKGHECDPDTKLSVAALAKEAKPCPKCAASISKIDGCDQMWCTQCHTAFSWRTGAVETRIHNPHYYDWMRRNGRTIPAAGGPPGGAPPEGACLANNEVIPQVQHHYWNDPVIQQACRAILHGEGLLRQYQRQDRLLNEEDARALLRVKRLLAEITEDTWKDKLQRIDKAKKKNACVLAVLDMYVQAGTDLLRGALPAEADRPAISKQVSDLRKYCTGELGKVHKRYNCEVPFLT